MLLTVFTDSGVRGGARHPRRENSVTLHVDALGALDAKVYEQQSHHLHSEAEVSEIVSQVYQAALTLVRLHGVHALHVKKELAPLTLPQPQAWRGAVNHLQTLINDGQKRLQVTSASNLHSATVATSAQKKYGFELYSSFLRAIHAASTCSMQVVAKQRDVVQGVQDKWVAYSSMSSFGWVTIEAQDQIAAVVEVMQKDINNCLAGVDALRGQHVSRLKQVTLPLDLHMNLCKSFLSQVRQWLLDFTST